MTVRVYQSPRRLDKRVQVQGVVRAKGASGGWTDSWVPGKTYWAGIKTDKGSKEDATKSAGGAVPESTHEITMYFIAGVTPTTHRLKHRSTIYEILAVENIYEQDQKMVLRCRTGVNNG